MSHQATDTYLTLRGIEGSTPEALNQSLQRVLAGVEPMVHEPPTAGLTTAEQEALVAGGLRLERTSGRDLVAESAVRFAALVEHSLTAEQVAKKIGMTASRVRQLVVTREIYSFRLDGKRLIPDFQILNGKLVPNIGQVNQALLESLHPLGVFNWYHVKSADLFVDEEQEVLRSPLEWLTEGRDPEPLVFIAQHL